MSLLFVSSWPEILMLSRTQPPLGSERGLQTVFGNAVYVKWGLTEKALAGICCTTGGDVHRKPAYTSTLNRFQNGFKSV